VNQPLQPLRPPGSSSQPVPLPSPGAAAEPRQEVVIVDDDGRLRPFLAGELAVEGYAVREAAPIPRPARPCFQKLKIG